MTVQINLMQVRECLESTYTHVTFRYTERMGLTSFWYVGDGMTGFKVEYINEQVVVSNEACADAYFKMSDMIFAKAVTIENNQNEKVENKMENKKIAGIELNVLRNGVRVLENGIENNFEEAQRILNVNRFARDVDAQCAWNARDYTHFENSYEVQVQRVAEFTEFVNLMAKENCINSNLDSMIKQYHNGEIAYDEYSKKHTELTNCKCIKCELVRAGVTMEAWKTNSIEVLEWNDFLKAEKARKYKLGKYLLKCGFSTELVDFYGQQIKTEKLVYLTITSAPQFVAGMSFYAKPRSWDGYNGTSCMDTRHGGSYSRKLGGALHDNMLHVAFLHESMDDLQNMTDKMLARVVMRPIEVEDEIVLVPTRYYGNNVTKNLMDIALNQLNELLIFGENVTRCENADDDFDTYEESIDGGYEMTEEVEEEVEGGSWETLSCECPACSGYGEITREVGAQDIEVTFTCPVCNGDGQYEHEVYVEWSETATVEIDAVVYCYYNDEGDHYEFNECNDSYEMTVNTSMIQRAIKKYINGVDEVIEVDEELREVEA